MKTMLLLGAASSFVFALAPTSTFAQTTPTISSASVALTCRSALQGGEFSQVQDIASPPCCYVSIEEDWYKANGIRIASIYQRSNGDSYRAESCELASDAGLPLDQTTTGSIGVENGTPVAVQPIGTGSGVLAGTAGPSVLVGGATGGGTSGGNTSGSGGGQTGGGSTGGNSGGQTGGGNTGGHGNGNGDSGGDGNNGHGNDLGGFDGSNPGNSSGTANNGNNGGGNGGGHGGQSGDREHGNNGFGNGGNDGPPNGMDDRHR